MWASLITSIISGVLSPFFGWLNKKEDVSLEKFKVDGTVDIAAVQAHVEALKARRDALIAETQYRGVRFAQYMFMYPLGIWWAANVSYCIVHPYYPSMPPVLALAPGLMEWGAGIVGFLFLTSKIDNWVRKT